ncbi:MAG: TetR/AcrR family transcriptional regulator [Syntrophomonadaceae bacterium]|nr:TetR/AcrR family transcriptional regulator [Syntrophomonadaceae bacterium]
MTKKMDQRVRLTRDLLKNALVKLMQEQHISKISIRAICEVADINRSTFYAHYSSPYELLEQVQQEVLANLKTDLNKQTLDEDNPLSVQVLTRVMEYIRDNKELFKALLSDNYDFAFQKEIMELAQIISAQQNPSLDEKTQDYIKIFGLSGAISILKKWLYSGAHEAPDQMAGFIIQISYYGISSFKNK